jgi:hypothetical protein
MEDRSFRGRRVNRASKTADSGLGFSHDKSCIVVRAVRDWRGGQKPERLPIHVPTQRGARSQEPPPLLWNKPGRRTFRSTCQCRRNDSQTRVREKIIAIVVLARRPRPRRSPFADRFGRARNPSIQGKPASCLPEGYED